MDFNLTNITKKKKEHEKASTQGQTSWGEINETIDCTKFTRVDSWFDLGLM